MFLACRLRRHVIYYSKSDVLSIPKSRFYEFKPHLKIDYGLDCRSAGAGKTYLAAVPALFSDLPPSAQVRLEGLAEVGCTVALGDWHIVVIPKLAGAADDLQGEGEAQGLLDGAGEVEGEHPVV